MIPISDLICGGVYLVSSRNWSLAVWDGATFWGVRYKFSDDGFLSAEKHWRDGDGKTGTVKPQELLGRINPSTFSYDVMLAHLLVVRKERQEKSLPVHVSYDSKEYEAVDYAEYHRTIAKLAYTRYLWRRDRLMDGDALGDWLAAEENAISGGLKILGHIF